MRVGDAAELSLLGLPEASVDCVITSPPYWHLKKYGNDDAREIGRAQTKQDYLASVRAVFAQCLELAKRTGVMWVVADTLREPSRRPGPGELIPLPFELADLARDCGWRLQDVVVWAKNKTLPYSGEGKLRNLIEYVLFFTKSQEFKHRPYRCAERHGSSAEWLAGWPERYHPLGKRPANLWQIDIDTQGIWQHSERLHYCPFPQELVARLIDLTTDKGDLVFDPFAGVGTVPAQAIAMGRRALGLELNPDSVRAFEERVLPKFQASWEAGAEQRRLAREDQFQEATTILKLRLLKAGKELLSLVDRLAQGTSARHPADAIESVLVIEPPDLQSMVRLDSGEVTRPMAELILVGQLATAARRELQRDIESALGEPPFTTFGLDLKLRFVEVADLQDRVHREGILEFAQSRHGAFTAPIDPTLLPNLPRLLTTVRLDATIRGDKDTPLGLARRQAERTLLESELSSGASIAEIAMKLGLPQAKLHEMLLEHELVEGPHSFAISLPGQLAIASD